MKQRILIIYTTRTDYVSMLHAPKSKKQLKLGVEAELCKDEYKGRPGDLFVLEDSNVTSDSDIDFE